MAKRMFSTVVVDSDAFLDMPLSSQALYFHLSVHADDDGFVSPKKIIRSCGAAQDDFNVLVGKRFLLVFESGICVIKHWRINNYIRKDRYSPTPYQDEYKLLRVKENMAYTLDEMQGKPALEVPWKSDSETRGTPDGIPPVSIGKDRIGKDRIERKPTLPKKAYGEMKNVMLTDDEKEKLIDRYGRSAAKDYVEKLSVYISSKGKKYRSHYATILNWMRRDKVPIVQKPAAPTTETPEIPAPISEDRKKAIREALRHPRETSVERPSQ